MITVLTLLSQLKYNVLMMTANFVDLMIIDTDTVTFLFTIFSALRWAVAVAIIVAVPVLVLIWRLDPCTKNHLPPAAPIRTRVTASLTAF
jgi:hypothetical protein